MKLINALAAFSLAAPTAALGLAAPAFALPAAVCGNGQHVGNPHCQQDSGNITATLDALGHSCDISVSDYNIDLIPGAGGTASARDAAAFDVSQSSNTTWALSTLTQTGPTALSAADITVEIAGQDLTADLSSGASINVGGELDNSTVAVEASMTASNGGFATGTYVTGTVLTCVQN
ncbi:hypothetical protein [Synechococcus phage S-B68]|nr:hypothetical protein [Synechococcus phage S-B68]